MSNTATLQLSSTLLLCSFHLFYNRRCEFVGYPQKPAMRLASLPLTELQTSLRCDISSFAEESVPIVISLRFALAARLLIHQPPSLYRSSSRNIIIIQSLPLPLYSPCDAGMLLCTLWITQGLFFVYTVVIENHC